MNQKEVNKTKVVKNNAVINEMIDTKLKEKNQIINKVFAPLE